MSALDRKAKAHLWRHRNEIVAAIKAGVVEEYGVTLVDIDGRSKVTPLPEARHEVMTRLWERGLSLSEIGRLLGYHQSAVNHAVRKSMGDQYAEISPGPGKVRPMPQTNEDAAE